MPAAPAPHGPPGAVHVGSCRSRVSPRSVPQCGWRAAGSSATYLKAHPEVDRDRTDSGDPAGHGWAPQQLSEHYEREPGVDGIQRPGYGIQMGDGFSRGARLRAGGPRGEDEAHDEEAGPGAAEDDACRMHRTRKNLLGAENLRDDRQGVCDEGHPLACMFGPSKAKTEDEQERGDCEGHAAVRRC